MKGFRILFLCLTFLSFFACEGDKEHIADAINEADSLAFMRSKGISTLISDSGIIKYRLIAEEWDIHTTTTPATWKFMKGLLMERYDRSYNIDLYVQADTAYLHTQSLWELRGRVVMRNVEGTVFLTEECFWDMDRHEIWNTKFMRIITPERELQGTDFRSNEEMTDYYVSNSAGSFPAKEANSTNNGQQTADSSQQMTNHSETQKDASPAKNNQQTEEPVPLRPAPQITKGKPVGKLMPSAPGKAVPVKTDNNGHWK